MRGGYTVRGGFTVLDQNLSSDGHTVHEVRRGADGVVYCTCRGWINHKHCKHLDKWNRNSGARMKKAIQEEAASVPTLTPSQKAWKTRRENAAMNEKAWTEAGWCLEPEKARCVVVTSEGVAPFEDVTKDTVTVMVKKTYHTFMRSVVMILPTDKPAPEGKFKKDVLLKWCGEFEKGRCFNDILGALDLA